MREGLERIREALERDPGAPAEIRGRALGHGTLIAVKQGDFETARQLTEEKSQLHARTGDERGMGQSMAMLGVIAMEEGRYGDGRVLLERSKSIRERIGDEFGLQFSLHNLGLLAMTQGDYGRARAELGSGLAIAQKHGLEGRMANSACDLGFDELGDGRLDYARVRFGEAITAAVRLGWTENIAYSLVGLGAVAVAADELARAGHFLGQAERLVEDLHLNLHSYAEAVRVQVEHNLRSRLGEDRLEALRAEGRALTIDDAVSEALAALD